MRRSNGLSWPSGSSGWVEWPAGEYNAVRVVHAWGAQREVELLASGARLTVQAHHLLDERPEP